jgi:hypothetical protein
VSNSDFPGEIFGPVFSEIFSDRKKPSRKQKHVYKARLIKRKRRTRAQVLQLEEQIYAVLAEDHPQSIRHIFYRMTDPRLPEPVEKTQRGYTQVQNRCKLMREGGRIEYGWFEDMSRTGYFVNTFSDAGNFIESLSYQYRADLWRDADCRCEVWCESRSIAGVVLRVCQEMAVSLYPCGGFTGMTFAYDAAMIHNHPDDTRPLQIFYIGDYDPAGKLIDQALQKELRKHLNPDIELRFTRIGINQDQISYYDLATKPRKESEKRLPEMLLTVEAEAMPAEIMRGLLRDVIESLLPVNALRVARVAEKSEKAHLDYVARMLSRDQ